MRVTSHMINHGALKNIQSAQGRVSDTTTQLTTGKLIQKASDDPVIAMRALKLRTTVSQLQQYKEKNIKDANSWMDVTETSLNNVVDRLTDVYDYCVQGANDTYDTAARASIIDSLQSLKDMIYSEGSATYAGRYIFSGFRTGTDLAFSTKESVKGVSYDINESLNSDDFKLKKTVTNPMQKDQIDSYLADPTTYEPPRDSQAYTIKLAYDNLEDTNFALTFDGKTVDELGYTFVTKDDTQVASYYDVNPNEVAYIPETGELVFGENAYKALQSTKEIKTTYTKSTFEVGDLRPDHYFDCVKHEPQSDGTIKDIQFTQTDDGQEIQYEVNFNQYLTVNTQGKDAITHDMGNAIDELSNALKELNDIEALMTNIRGKLNDPTYNSDEDNVKMLNQLLADADVEMALKRDNLTKLFEKGETTFTNFMSDVAALQSDVGTKMDKLEMISVRVNEQYVNFKELKSDNEDVESEEAIINWNESQLTYNASLAATSNILQTSLLDYL